MPIMDGIELTEKLAASGSLTTAIIVSAYDERKYLQHAIRSPIVFDYVLKPFPQCEFNDLISSVSAHILERRAARNGKGTISDFADTLAALMRQNDEAEAMDSFDRFRRSHESDSLKVCGEILMRLEWSAHNRGDYKAVLRIYDYLKTLDNCRSADEVYGFMAAYIRRKCRTVAGNSRITALVTSCLKLLDQHYWNKSFGIAEASDLLNVTPNYLSARFSRDMDISFTRYLTLLRIEKAKEYLADASLKIFRISDAVGFVDCGYFARVFRENVGITPSEYRNDVIARKG